MSTYPIYRWFYFGAGVMLLGAAGAKLVSLWLATRILYMTNPLLGVQNQYVFWAAGLLELSLVAVLALGRNPLIKAEALLWLSACFIAYRLANWWYHIPEPCPCFGRVGDWIPWLAPYLEPAAIAVLIYITLGSTTVILLSVPSVPRFFRALRGWLGAATLVAVCLGSPITSVSGAEPAAGELTEIALDAKSFPAFLRESPAIDTLIFRRTLFSSPKFFLSKEEGERYLESLEEGNARLSGADEKTVDMVAIRHLPSGDFMFQEISKPQDAWASSVREKAFVGRDSEGWWRFHPLGLESTDASSGVYLENDGQEQRYFPMTYRQAVEPLRLGMYDLDPATFELVDGNVAPNGTSEFTAKATPEYGGRRIEGTITAENGVLTQVSYSLEKASTLTVQARQIRIVHKDGNLQHFTVSNRYKDRSDFIPYANYEFLSWTAAPNPIPDGFCSPRQFMTESDNWFLTKANGEVFNMKLDPNNPVMVKGNSVNLRSTRQAILYGVWVALTVVLFWAIFLRKSKKQENERSAQSGTGQ